jgi:hypothetical protein
MILMLAGVRSVLDVADGKVEPADDSPDVAGIFCFQPLFCGFVWNRHEKTAVIQTPKPSAAYPICKALGSEGGLQLFLDLVPGIHVHLFNEHTIPPDFYSREGIKKNAQPGDGLSKRLSLIVNRLNYRYKLKQ